MTFRAKLPLITWYTTVTIMTIVAWAIIQQKIDSDLWWRMRHGQDILVHGFSIKDTYDYTMSNFPFVSHAWLFDMLSSFFYRFGGYTSLSILITALVSAAFARVTFSYREKWAGSIYVLALWAGGIASFGVRAQVFAWPLIFAALWLCCTPRTTWEKYRWAFPLLAVLWANVHGSFPLLFLFVGLRCLADWITERRLDWHDVVIIACSIPLTLLNPYGIGLWREVWLTNSDPTLRISINEWHPLWQAGHIIIMFTAVTALAATAMVIYKKQWQLMLLILAASGLALTSIRNIPVLVFTACVCTFPLITAEPFPKKTAQRTLAFSAVALFIALLVAQIKPLLTQDPTLYPVDAVTVMQHRYPTAKVLNAYDWGGYLIWNRPEGKVFIDGRMPSWRWTTSTPPTDLAWAHDDWIKMSEGNREVFEQDVARFSIDTVLWKTPWGTPDPLLNLLKAEGWMPVYADETAVLYRSPTSFAPVQ
jgi:hypothetical protein